MTQNKELNFYQKLYGLFLVQFLGATNDNFLKNALIIFITFYLAIQQDFNPTLIITIASGLFILPFFLFGGTVGCISDEYDSILLIKLIKFSEIIIMILASIGFYFENLYFLIFVLFLMGTQSTFFGPIKYSSLVFLFKEQNLVRVNAYISSGTFIAILLGSISGAYFILTNHGILIVCSFLIVLSILGFIFSFFIPKFNKPYKKHTAKWNFIYQIYHLLFKNDATRMIKEALIGNSWFWFIGASILSQLPTFVSITITSSNEVFILFLALFTIGIGIGSFTSYRIMGTSIKPKSSIIGCLGMSIFLIDFYFASSSFSQHSDGQLYSLNDFIANPNNIRFIVDILGMAIFGGIYYLPFQVIIQKYSPNDRKSSFISLANIYNAAFMVSSAVIISILLKFSFTIEEIFLTIGAMNLLTIPLFIKAKLFQNKL